MAHVTKGRSGRAFFLMAVFVVFAAILTTFLAANDLRNLNHVLARFGYPPLTLTSAPEREAMPDASRTVRVVKGVRLPAPSIRVPAYGLMDMGAPPQSFIRSIRSDPRGLCDMLKTNGFPDIAWSTSAASSDSFECTSFLPVGTAHPDAIQSSVFVSLKGDRQDSLSSFRVKFNIEAPSDTQSVVAAGTKAIGVFLRQVQWEDDATIIARIQALENFDLRDFGSHIQFKREFGETPRYNFLANQLTRPQRTIGDTFFDAASWLRLSDAGPGLWMPESGLGRHVLPLPGSDPPKPRAP